MALISSSPRRSHLRLAIWSHNYAPEQTGIPFYNTGMAEWFARVRRWPVTVHTGLPHYPWWKVPADYAARDYRHGRGDETLNGVRVERVRHYVPELPLSGAKRMRLDASYLLAWFWRSLFASRKPQIIVLVAPPFLIGFLALWLRWRWRCPVVYHVQDLQVDAALDMGMLPARLGGVLRWLERFITARVDLVTTCSDGMRRKLQAKGPTRRPVALFPNWADVESIRPWTEANRYRAGIADDQVLCVYSGNIGKKQGLEDLVTAFDSLRDGPSCRLAIAGAGAHLPEITRQVQATANAAITLRDLVPVTDLREFLASGDIHCIPQKRAVADLVMPSKLLNIMAVGRPLVAAAEPGTELARTIAAAGCGLVVPPEDPAAFAAALRTLISDPALRSRMGAAGRAYVVAHLAPPAVLGRFAARLLRLRQHAQH